MMMNLCDSYMSVCSLLLLSCVHSLGLGLDLGNSLDRRDGANAHALIQSYTNRRAAENKPTAHT